MSVSKKFRAMLTAVFANLRTAQRYEYLFSMSEAELSARGLDREKLVRGFVTGFAYG